MKKRFYFILFFILLIGYLIFFPHQLKKELLFIPSWALSIEDASPEGGSADSMPFRLDAALGYFSADGRILFSENVPYEAAVSKDFFINYSSVSRNLVLKDDKGGIIGSIDTEGLPFFIGKRFFIVSPDRMNVSEYDVEGNLLLLISPGSVITSIDAGVDTVVIGLLNGEVSVYSDGSEPDFTYFSTDSRYSITYACAITDDGARFAVVTGLYPQQLVCFERRNSSYQPVYAKTMTDVYKRNMLISYSDDGKLLYLEAPEGLEVYSTSTFMRENIELAGIISDYVFSSEKKMSFIISSEQQRNLFRVFRPDLGRLAEFNFPPGEIYFYPAGNCFYVGVDGRLLRGTM